MKLYSCAIFKQGLKARKVEYNGEEEKVLDRPMEYTGVVGVEVADMLASVNKKVQALEPHVPAQHTFRGDGLQNFIQDHQDHLKHLEGQLGNLTTMVDHMVRCQDITLESYCWDLCWVEQLNSELLRWVVALERG